MLHTWWTTQQHPCLQYHFVELSESWSPWHWWIFENDYRRFATLIDFNKFTPLYFIRQYFGAWFIFGPYFYAENFRINRYVFKISSGVKLDKFPTINHCVLSEQEICHVHDSCAIKKKQFSGLIYRLGCPYDLLLFNVPLEISRREREGKEGQRKRVSLSVRYKEAKSAKNNRIRKRHTIGSSCKTDLSCANTNILGTPKLASYERASILSNYELK